MEMVCFLALLRSSAAELGHIVLSVLQCRFVCCRRSLIDELQASPKRHDEVFWSRRRHS